MNKNKFYFVNWLTKKDIKNIIGKMGFKFSEDRYKGKLINPIRRYTDSDGYKHIVVFCKKINSSAERKLMENFLSSYLNRVGIFYDNFMFGTYETVLNFTDFEVFESVSLKNEEAFMDFYTKINDTYEKYMNNKFGEFYKQNKKQYLRNLRKQESCNKKEELEEQL